MGLKESGLRGSIRNVSTGIGAAISIDTLEAENIDNESATIRGEITALTNFGEQSEVFFEWGEDSAGLPNTTDIQEQGEVGIFTEELTGLETGESYEFQAFGSVRDVSDEGAILSFETDDFEIAVTTLEAENVEADSATIRGEITALTNFGEDAEVFFEWGEITQGLPNTTDIQLQDTVGVFTEDLTNLSQDTTHEFQAFGSVQDVSDEGVVLTFETGAIPDSVVRHYDATRDGRDFGTQTSIPDQKGNVDLDDGTQVELVEDGINGLNSYLLDGTDDYLVYDGSSVTTPWTLFAVIQRDSSARGELIDRGGGGLASNNGGLTTEDSDRVFARDAGGGDFDLEVLNPDLENQTALIVYEITGSDGELRVWDPNLDTDTGSGDGTDFGDEVIDFFRDGRDQRYLDGYVGEIAVAESEFDSELESFEEDLLNKWGIN